MYKTAVFLFSLLIFFYGLKCLKRSLDWRNEYQLFVSAVSVCPLNAKVHYNVAKALDAKNMTNLAIAEYKEAIRLYPEYYQAMNNLGNLLKSKKSFNEAEFYLRSAVTIKKDFPAAWMNLGIVLAAVDKFNESETAYKTALTYRKIYPDCHYNMGNLYLELNRTEEAMKCWQHAVNLDPTHILAWTNLLAFLDNNDRLETALNVIPIALSQLPTSPQINFAVGNIYGKLELFEQAESHFLKAIELWGKEVQALHYSNLGVLYHRWRKFKKAEKMYKAALKVEPNFQSARNNLRRLKENQRIRNHY